MRLCIRSCCGSIMTVYMLGILNFTAWLGFFVTLLLTRLIYRLQVILSVMFGVLGSKNQYLCSARNIVAITSTTICF